MSLDHCEEYVGPATGTGQRRTCSKPSDYYATHVTLGTVVALCRQHIADYRQPGWRVVRIVR